MCVDDWILVAQQSPMAAGARGFGLGHAFSREGDLVALCLVIIGYGSVIADLSRSLGLRL